MAKELTESFAGLEGNSAIGDGGEIVGGERDGEIKRVGGRRRVCDYADVLRAGRKGDGWGRKGGRISLRNR
jgi:hypothetical protein